MARTFAAASSQYLEYNGALVTAYPFTMSGWFNPIATSANVAIMGITGAADYWCLYGTSTGILRFRSQVAATARNADTANSYTASAWNHGIGIATSSTDRVVILNGGTSVQNTQSSSPGSLTKTAIGQRGSALSGFFMDGRIAEVALWNVALTTAEATMLNLGVSPLRVRPQSIVGYWPLLGRFSPEIDVRGRNEMVVTGATVGDHCRIIYPGAFLGDQAPATVAPTYAPPVFRRLQRIVPVRRWY